MDSAKAGMASLENHKRAMGILGVLGILVSFKEQTITVAASFLDGAPTCARWYLMKRTKFATADVP
jgi:xanthosine utilization system XapX-like protein